jgi:hypothetical protein
MGTSIDTVAYFPDNSQNSLGAHAKMSGFVW